MAYLRKVRDKARRLWLQGYSFEKIVQQPDMPSKWQTIHNWARKENWKEELDIIVQRAGEKRIENLSNEVTKMNDEHLELLRATQARIDDDLREGKLEFNSMRDLVYSLEKVIMTQRVIQGEVTERKADIISGTINIEQLSDTELDDFIAAGLEDEIKLSSA